MFDFWLFFALFIGTALLSLAGTRFLMGWLYRNNIMAQNTARSSHTTPTPVGGGWVLFGLSFLAMAYLYYPFSQTIDLVILCAMSVLAFISWLDDKKFVSPKIRMALHILAVGTTLTFLPSDSVVFAHYLPLWLERLLIAFAWLWFINLYNFMDGIDGIVGTETIFIALGLLLTGAVIGMPFSYLASCVVVAGASAGFLGWNWHPAKIFMGDVGAITMGFLLGWLLLQMALTGHIWVALILPLYFLVDASYTLSRRFYQGKNIFRPHKSHFYQQAAIALSSHSAVVLKIALANSILVLAALWSLSYPLSGIFLAVVTVSALIRGLIISSVRVSGAGAEK